MDYHNCEGSLRLPRNPSHDSDQLGSHTNQHRLQRIVSVAAAAPVLMTSMHELSPYGSGSWSQPAIDYAWSSTPVALPCVGPPAAAFRIPPRVSAHAASMRSYSALGSVRTTHARDLYDPAGFIDPTARQGVVYLQHSTAVTCETGTQSIVWVALLQK